jgi:ABC-type dipeptide/oligopeptide/nickel transport system permease component
MVLVVEFLTTARMEVIPGSYCSSHLPDHASIETRQNCHEHEPGLFEKYLIGLKNLTEFDLGYSLQGSRRAISLELSEHLPATLWLGSISGLLGLGLGVTGGVLAVKGRRRWWGGLLNGLAIGMLALPAFVLAVLLR